MNLSGEKIVLRAIEEADNEMLLSLLNDPETESLLGGWSFPASLSNQMKWYSHLGEDKNTLRCIIEVEGKAIGTIILNNIDYKNGTACLSIKIIPGDFRGKGYGTDSVKTIVQYAFSELRLNCVYAFVLDYNLASQKMFAKCGFEKEGILRERCYKQGRYNSYVSFSILNGERHNEEG